MNYLPNPEPTGTTTFCRSISVWIMNLFKLGLLGCSSREIDELSLRSQCCAFAKPKGLLDESMGMLGS
jgi:hypothetical protein